MTDILRKPSVMTFSHLSPLSLDAYSNVIEQQEQRIAQLKRHLGLMDKKSGALRIKSPDRMFKLKQEHEERVRAYIELELLEENLAQEKARVGLGAQASLNATAIGNNKSPINHNKPYSLIDWIKLGFKAASGKPKKAI